VTARSISPVSMRTFARSYPGERRQVRLVRGALASMLEGCPRVDDAVLIGSELAANAVVHSNSAEPDGQFVVRAEVRFGDYIRIAVEDQGGPWAWSKADDGCAHGMDLVDALAGTGNWGIAGDPEHGRIAWARLDWPSVS